MIDVNILPALEYSTDIIIDRVLSRDRRVLFFGEPGIGKSTLATTLAGALVNAGRRVRCIGADPGAPTFGIPGAVCLGEWHGKDWGRIALEALCTLDAGRFRLPLVSATRRLAVPGFDGVLFIDAPGVSRGVAGAELLVDLVEAAGIEVVLVLARAGAAPPYPSELAAIASHVFVVPASSAAHRASKRQRARQRTRLWDAYLANSEETHIALSDVQLIGTPPPIDVPAAWRGRQIALLDGARTLALGEVVHVDSDSLEVLTPRGHASANVLLVRDARRGENGLLNTAKPFGSTTLQYIPPPDVAPYPGAGSDGGPCPVARVGAATVTLVNGIFGDPLLHLRLRHQKRSLLFDLGEGGRLPNRVAHQVTDVFISHAHIDHIAGFLWLLRSRIGDFSVCRLYGPPGIADNIVGLVSGIHWDRIGEHGPRFEVAELHDTRLIRFAIQAGHAVVSKMDEVPVTDGVVLDESAFRVRAITVDHRTPVLAFAFEPPRQLNIRKERLIARGLAVGPWLGELKQRIADDKREALIRLPGGQTERASVLGDDLVLIAPGQKLVYATDLADTADNRERLTGFAKGAHTFFCEATFVEEDVDKAISTGHLTARACGEIATAAGVEHLVPFHFSRRYEDEPERVYEEVRAVCSRVVMPR
jgi:ribonuclease BN (tRNA processing enzyme)/energy-coupling factor transporter ATP-binding protein EcfA2